VGPTVSCTNLGTCPEFLNIGTGARVAAFRADPQWANWGLSHPVSGAWNGFGLYYR